MLLLVLLVIIAISNKQYCNIAAPRIVNRWYHPPSAQEVKNHPNHYKTAKSKSSWKKKLIVINKRSGEDNKHKMLGYLIEFLGVELFLELFFCKTRTAIEVDAAMLWQSIPELKTYVVQYMPLYIEIKRSNELANEEPLVNNNDGLTIDKLLIKSFYLDTSSQYKRKIEDQNRYWINFPRESDRINKPTVHQDSKDSTEDVEQELLWGSQGRRSKKQRTSNIPLLKRPGVYDERGCQFI